MVRLRVADGTAPGIPPRSVECRVALLAGGIHRPPLAAVAGASLLEAQVAPGLRLVDHWAQLFERAGGECACVVIGDAAARGLPTGWVSVPDSGEYRGPAGAARDAFADAAGDDVLVLAEAARLVRAPLGEVLARAREPGIDGVVCTLADESPAGVYALRRRVLDLVPARGFMDLKEQLLTKAVAAGRRIVVHRLEGKSIGIATRPAYLAALGLAGVSVGAPGGVGLRGAAGSGAASLIAPDAQVDPSAVVAGSVVMGGASVGAGAIVVRSVVWPGGVVASGRRVVDTVVGSGGESAGEFDPIARGSIARGRTA